MLPSENQSDDDVYLLVGSERRSANGQLNFHPSTQIVSAHMYDEAFLAMGSDYVESEGPLSRDRALSLRDDIANTPSLVSLSLETLESKVMQALKSLLALQRGW